MDFVSKPSKEAVRNSLYSAAINCGHSIVHDQIILRREDNVPGNALAQLATRLTEAFENLIGASAIGNTQSSPGPAYSASEQLSGLLRGLGAGDILKVSSPDLLYRFGLAIAEAKPGFKGCEKKATPQQPAPAGLDGVKVITDLLRFSYEHVCVHEETHRGGAIWEICDSCGAKWADDEGGKPAFVWPPAVVQAENFLETVDETSISFLQHDAILNKAAEACGRVGSSAIGHEGTKAVLDCIDLIRGLQKAPTATLEKAPEVSPGKVSWVRCPVCGEDDMRQTIDDDGAKLINCVNHGCLSNGGTMCAGLPHEHQRT